MSSETVVHYLRDVLGVQWVAPELNSSSKLSLQLIDVAREREVNDSLKKLSERLGQALVDEWTRTWTQLRSDPFPSPVTYEWVDSRIGIELDSSTLNRAVVFGDAKACGPNALKLPRLSEIATSTEIKRRSWQQMQEHVQAWVRQWSGSEL